MKNKFLLSAIFLLPLLCCGCDIIDEINPVVQTGKMQNSAKYVTDEVTQIHNYALEEQKKALEQLKINED